MNRVSFFVVVFLFSSIFFSCRNNSDRANQNSNAVESGEALPVPVVVDSTEMFVGKENIEITLYWEKSATVKMKNLITDLVKNMILVEGGTFEMGCNRNEACESFELPVHQVFVDKFYICKFEVMQKLWAAFMMEEVPVNYCASNPVTDVSWEECDRFIRKINWISGLNFRLPTEAEWEFAARGGIHSGNFVYAGSNKVSEVGWSYQNSDWKTHEVSKKNPNEIGLYDMSGNVWEWCSDWYAPYDSIAQRNPFGPEAGTEKVFRGGGFSDSEDKLSVSYRKSCPPEYKMNCLGFRVVLDN